MSNYTSSKITHFKHGECPICLGDRKDCRSTGELIHCYSHNEPPLGYEFIRLSGIGASLYAPVRDDSKPYDHEAARAKREARLAKEARQHQQFINSLPSIEDRDRKIKSYPQKLTYAQNSDLLRRGLTQDEINYALANHWLFGLQGSYGISAYDPISGLLCGAQRAKDDRDPKYDWGIFTGKNQLKETGENPLFVRCSPNFDSSKPYHIKYCEGALKSLIRALQEWRSNPQIIVIGSAGGIFGNKALKRVLSAYPDAKSHTLLPDSDSQNAKKLNIDKAYSNLANAVPKIKFADWGQWHQTKLQSGKDCDEVYGTDSFNRYDLRSPDEFTKFFQFEQSRKAAKQRIGNITHDIEITHEEFQKLDYDSLMAITGNARDIFINAHKGAGKTVLAIAIVNAFKNALIPSHRKALAVSNGVKFGATYRTDCDRVGSDFVTSEGYVEKISFCNEAIFTLLYLINSLLDKGALVVNDELDQQIESLATSSTHAKSGRRRLHDDSFWNMQMRAPKTLSISADLTDYEVKLFEKRTGRKPFVIRVKPVQKHYKALLYEQFADFWQQFLKAKSEGKRILVLCSRKEDVKFLNKTFGAIAVHADNANDYRDFLDNPNEWLANNNPSLMSVSPVLGTGFSITHDAFDMVLGWFHADNLSAKALMQFIDRYRLPVERHIFCDYSSNRFNGLTVVDLVRDRMAKAKANPMLDHEDSYINPDDPYFHYKAETNWSLAHLRADLLARLEHEVIDVTYVRSQLSEHEHKALTKELYQQFKEYRDTYYVTVFEARNLSLSEYLAKKDRQDLSESDRLAVTKFEIADWSCLTPEQLTLERVQRDKKGKKRRALERLEMQAFPQIAKAIDRASLEKQTKHGAGISQQDISHHTLRVDELDKLGIGEALDFALSGEAWHSQTAEIVAIASKINRKREYLAKIGINLQCGKNASLNAIWGATLQYFGIRTIRTQKRIEGKVTSFYQVCTDDLTLTKQDLIARLDRNIERYGELIADPQKSFIEKLYGCHTPFENSNIQKVCDSFETVMEQTLQDEAIETTNQENNIEVIDNGLDKQDVAIAQPKLIERVKEMVVNTVTDVVDELISYLTLQEIAEGYF